MLRSNSHLTDRQIILLVDGEMDARDHREAREHLDACWSCRSRMAETEGTITDFAVAYRDSLDALLPPAAGPRALLKAQLQNQPAGTAPPWWDRLFASQLFANRRASVAVSLMVACLAVFAVYERGVSHRTGDLLVPKNSLTPGETRTVTLGDVCSAAPEQNAASIPISLQQQVFREYGIKDQRPNAYEVDYLITPELGGANSLRNLWPQSYSPVWNAHVKDELEDRLHGLVCSGQVDLATAQRDISSNWIRAYKKYFHTDRPF